MRDDTVIRHIDDALRRFASRDLVAGSEIVDFLLDLRATVTREAAMAELELEPVS